MKINNINKFKQRLLTKEIGQDMLIGKVQLLRKKLPAEDQISKTQNITLATF